MQTHGTSISACRDRVTPYRSRPDVVRGRLTKDRLGSAADRVSTRVLPNWFLRLAALRNPALKGLVPHLGVNMNATSEKARRLLGWAPRSREEAIVATAASLIRLGLVKAAA